MDFDWDWYLFQNNDLVNAGITTPKGALDHYLHHGKHELRKYVIDWNSKEAMYLYKIYLKCLPDNISDHIDTPLSVNKYYKQYGNVKYDTKITTLLNIGCSFANCDYFLSIDDFSKIYYPGNTVKSTYDIIKKDPKIEFRYFCYRYLDYIRQYSIPDIKLNNYKEAVLIEFRDFPHIEFTIRNCIHKLGNSWSFTVVCGLDNQKLIKDILSNISNNIRIIVMNYHNIDAKIYNELLASQYFWGKMCGEKILIYQEDSCIFRRGIDEFLRYDYVGAPCPPTSNENKLSVGNGGFSIRSKKIMLQVINTINMNDTGCNIEDVYFTRVMIEYNIGLLANSTDASRFSIESIYNSKAIGGHNFWLCDSNWKKHLYETVVIQLNPDHDSLKGIQNLYHRGGWKTVLNTLIKTDFYNLNDTASYNFLDMIEGHTGANDLTKDTICMIHGTKEKRPEFNVDWCQVSTLVTMERFTRIKNKIRVILTCSNYMIDHIHNLTQKNTLLIRHPIDINPSIKFTLDKFKNNHQKTIIQIGQQMRYYKTIFEIDIPKYRKIWLPGSEELCINFRRQFSSGNVNICHFDNYSDYDDILSRNIVLCHLLDANANNTLLECIVRNTPIIINRHPAVVEYLGANYPLYFDSINDINDLVDMDLIEKAHNYLCSLDKTFINFETFTDRLFNIVYEVVNENKY